MPKVSVIIPSYNRAEYIGETIESVLAQNFEDFELLFIDDGSTDSTEAIVARYVEQDSRIKYHKKTNEERAKARSYGISLATGDYIALVDSDDIWYPEKLEEQLDVFDAFPEVGFVYAAVDRIDMQGRSLAAAPRQREGFSGFVYFDLLNRNFVPSVTPMIKREILSTLGVQRTEFIPYEDWDFWLRISRRTQFHHIDEPLGAYRIHPQQSVQNVKPNQIEKVTLAVLDANTTDACLQEYVQTAFEGQSAPATEMNFEAVRDEAYSLAYLRMAYWYLLAGDTDSAKSRLERSVFKNDKRRRDWRWRGLNTACDMYDWKIPGVANFITKKLGAMH